jgi:hypothetical protein
MALDDYHHPELADYECVKLAQKGSLPIFRDKTIISRVWQAFGRIAQQLTIDWDSYRPSKERNAHLSAGRAFFAAGHLMMMLDLGWMMESVASCDLIWYSQPDLLERTLLHVACESSHLDVPACLWDPETASSKYIETPDGLGQTPLLVAVLARNTNAIHTLRRAGANLEATDYQDQTPLGVAAGMGYDEIVRVLLDEGCEIHGHGTSIYDLPLYKAVIHNQLSTVCLLLLRGAYPPQSSIASMILDQAHRRGYRDIAAALQKEAIVLSRPHVFEHRSATTSSGVPESRSALSSSLDTSTTGSSSKVRLRAQDFSMLGVVQSTLPIQPRRHKSPPKSVASGSSSRAGGRLSSYPSSINLSDASAPLAIPICRTEQWDAYGAVLGFPTTCMSRGQAASDKRSTSHVTFGASLTGCEEFLERSAMMNVPNTEPIPDFETYPSQFAPTVYGDATMMLSAPEEVFFTSMDHE